MKLHRVAVSCLLLSIVAPVLTFAATANSSSPPVLDGAADEAISSLMELAALQVSHKAYAKAAATLERAIRIDGDDPELWHLLGHLHLLQGHYQQAHSMAYKSNSLAGDDESIKERNERLIIAAQRLAIGDSLALVLQDLYPATEQNPPLLVLEISKGIAPSAPQQIAQKIDQRTTSPSTAKTAAKRTTTPTVKTTAKSETSPKLKAVAKAANKQRSSKPKQVATRKPRVIESQVKNRRVQQRSDKPARHITKREITASTPNDGQRPVHTVQQSRWAASGYAGPRYPIHSPRMSWPKIAVTRAFQ